MVCRDSPRFNSVVLDYTYLPLSTPLVSVSCPIIPFWPISVPLASQLLTTPASNRTFGHKHIINMIPLHQSSQTLGVLFLLAASWSPVTTAIDVDICATLNTGSTDRSM